MFPSDVAITTTGFLSVVPASFVAIGALPFVAFAAPAAGVGSAARAERAKSSDTATDATAARRVLIGLSPSDRACRRALAIGPARGQRDAGDVPPTRRTTGFHCHGAAPDL